MSRIHRSNFEWVEKENIASVLFKSSENIDIYLLIISWFAAIFCPIGYDGGDPETWASVQFQYFQFIEKLI